MKAKQSEILTAERLKQRLTREVKTGGHGYRRSNRLE